jgi:hypothetical protein
LDLINLLGEGGGAFKFKLQAFHMHMMTKKLVVIAPFLSFRDIYNASKSHNMFTLMLHSWFKFFDVMKTCVGKVEKPYKWL